MKPGTIFFLLIRPSSQACRWGRCYPLIPTIYYSVELDETHPSKEWLLMDQAPRGTTVETKVEYYIFTLTAPHLNS